MWFKGVIECHLLLGSQDGFRSANVIGSSKGIFGFNIGTVDDKRLNGASKTAAVKRNCGLCRLCLAAINDVQRQTPLFGIQGRGDIQYPYPAIRAAAERFAFPEHI